MSLLENSGGQNVFGNACGAPRKCQNSEFELAGRPATAKTQNLVLAGHPANVKTQNLVLAGHPANVKTPNLSLRGTPQTSKLRIWDLRGAPQAFPKAILACSRLLQRHPPEKSKPHSSIELTSPLISITHTIRYRADFSPSENRRRLRSTAPLRLRPYAVTNPSYFCPSSDTIILLLKWKKEKN